MEITLTELLSSRDARVEHQRKLASEYPRASLICFTVILPGPVKRDSRSLAVANAGVHAIASAFGEQAESRHVCKVVPPPSSTPKIENFRGPRFPAHKQSGGTSLHASPEVPVLFQEERDLVTGYEAYFVVDLPAEEAKRICCNIEDTHPLGRLMDIDVIISDELAIRPVSRTEIGLQERTCLLCNRPARECMRAHTHTPEEIQEAINSLFK